MTALAADKEIARKETGPWQDYPVYQSTTIYKGALVSINATGYLIPATDTAGTRLAGVAMEGSDNSAGADGATTCKVAVVGVFPVVATSITQAMLGRMLYIADDQTVDETSTNFIPAGKMREYTSTTACWIEIDSATGYSLETIELLQGVNGKSVSDWTETELGFELAQAKTNGLAYIGATGLRVGDVITAIQLAGSINGTGGSVSALTATLQSVTGAAAASVAATIQAMDALADIAADTKIDETKALTTAYTVLTDVAVQLKLDGTTADNAACDIDISAWSLTIQRVMKSG